MEFPVGKQMQDLSIYLSKYLSICMCNVRMWGLRWALSIVRNENCVSSKKKYENTREFPNTARDKATRFPFRDHVCLATKRLRQRHTEKEREWVSERPRPRPSLSLSSSRSSSSAANLLIMQFNASTAHKLQHQRKKTQHQPTATTTRETTTTAAACRRSDASLSTLISNSCTHEMMIIAPASNSLPYTPPSLHPI